MQIPYFASNHITPHPPNHSGSTTPKRSPKRRDDKPTGKRTEHIKTCEGSESRCQLARRKHTSHRNSTVLGDSMILMRKPVTTCESKLTQMKSELQKLSYREKLGLIESVVRQCRDLCKEFGYFFITAAMFQFSHVNKIKLSVWIHPDSRVTRPLHPIKKNTDFECEILFISCLRSSLKELFPIIDLGSGKTFVKLLMHLTQQKKKIMQKIRKGSPANLSRTNDISISKQSEGQESQKLITSMKCMPKLRGDDSERTDFSREKVQQQKFQSRTFQKDTKSTLLQSFKSTNSFKDHMRAVVISTKNQSQRASKNKETKPNIQEEEDHQKTKPAPPLQEFDIKKNSFGPIEPVCTSKIFGESSKLQNCANNLRKQKMRSIILSENLTEAQKKKIKHSIMRKSRLGLMTTSIQIESQLDNLFGSDSFPAGFYFSNARQGRESILSKVAEEFEELLF